MERIFDIEGLDCANCAAKIERKLNELDGVESAVLTYTTGKLKITAEDVDALLPAIREVIETVEPDAELEVPGAHHHEHHGECHCHGGHPHEHHGECHCGECHEEHEHHHEHEHEHHHDHGHEHGEDEEENELPPILIGAGLFLLGVVLKLAGVKILGISLSLPCYLAAYLVLGLPVLLAAGKNLLRGQLLDEQFLMSIATLGALAIGEFPEAVGVMLFYRVGEYFEDKAVERSRSQVMAAADLRPETVHLVSGEEIPAEDAEVGDLLLVRPGDRIPLDGVVESGESRVDTAPVTGEPVPVRVTAGDPVISGCINTSGQLTVRVEKPLSESMVSRILNAVENAAASKPKIDRFITRFARIYTPAVVAIAALTAIIPSLITGDWGHWVYTALSFLVMSCPCALVLSIPLAFYAGIGAGSKRGILFKGGLSMEQMADLKVVALDKTGTVTKGDFSVQEISGDVLTLAYACEQNSTHPIAAGIVAEGKKLGISPAVPEALEEIAGHGVKAVIGGKTVLCGNDKLMAMFSVEVPAAERFGAVVHVAEDGKYLGYLCIADTVKPDAKNAISRLHSQGLSTALLTGDRRESAEAVAKELGIGTVCAELLPEQKLTALQDLREKFGAVMFVGDGINDAPVLSGADVGAAMGSGADAAIEAADVVLLHGNAEDIPHALSLAKKVRRTARQNVVFALGVKAAVMILGLCGIASMWLAVFADTGVAMLCILNSVRLLRK